MKTELLLPRLARVRQNLPSNSIDDVPAQVKSALSEFSGLIRPGDMIALTAGSRGIDRIPQVLAEVVEWLLDQGAKPFIVPAMGSHGGATAEGQLKLLASLGITQDSVRAPIVSDMQTVIIDEVGGFPVHLDRAASQAQGIIVVNRIKPHTSFRGDHESGLAKMIAVGLGKVQGASLIHSRGPRSLRQLIPAMASAVIKNTNVTLGLGLIENARDKIASIHAMPGHQIMAQEPGLLAQARTLMPRLPFKELDVLVVDRMGKDISGTGMDTNVIGRLGIRGETEPDDPLIKRIAVLDLSPRSGGSAYGIGLSDITTNRLVEKIDHQTTTANALAATFVERARIPLQFASDRDAIEAAISTCWAGPGKLRLARICDTLHLEEFLATPAALAQATTELEVIEQNVEWVFDESSNLL